MTNTNITNFRQNVFEYINQAVEYNDVINIHTKNGNAIVMSEEDYNSLMETLYLINNEKTKNDILEGMNTPIDDCVPENKVEW